MPIKTLAVAIGAGALLLTGCAAHPAQTHAGAISVTSTNATCAVSSSTVPSGTVVFDVRNTGDQVTEFYLVADDGIRIVSEVENIGPGTTRSLTVQARAGSYYTVCKPGMVGNGVDRRTLTVTESGANVSASQADQIRSAVTNYTSYVKDQSGRLLTATTAFAAAYAAGDDATARASYSSSRAYYERIEPVASRFGDLDPRLDLREADLAAGDAWTGWHRIERDLWPPADSDGSAPRAALTTDERATMSAGLVSDTRKLFDLVHASTFDLTIDSISNGAIGLLDEIANGKITGEEEIWSHTDLTDFQANLEGARVAYEGVRDLASSKDSTLTSTIDARLADLEKRLGAYQDPAGGFVSYTSLTREQVHALADGVNALSEPLSRLTATLVS